MDKFWYQGNEVLDLLHWTPEELFYAWRYGLPAYENRTRKVFPDQYLIFRRYIISNKFYYKFDINKDDSINNVEVEYFIRVDGKEERNSFSKKIEELDKEFEAFIFKDKYFSIHISKNGIVEFYRNNNINRKDLNDFYHMCTKAIYDYDAPIIDPVYLLGEEESVNINNFFEYEIEKYFLIRDRNKYINDKVSLGQFNYLMESNEELCIILKCYVRSCTTNDLKERRIYIQIIPNREMVENYIKNPYTYYNFDGFVTYIFIDGKTDWFIAPSVESINDAIALLNFDRLEKLKENNIIDVYCKAEDLEKNEHVYYKLEKRDDNVEIFYSDYVNSLYFKSNEIVKYLNFSNINVYISPYIFGTRYCNRKYDIINNSLFIKNIKSKIEYSIEKNKKYNSTSDINQDIEYKISIPTYNAPDQYLIQELFKNIKIKDENQEILLSLYKFLDDFKTMYKDNKKILEYIDIVKYKTIGMSNDDIQNSNKISSIHNKKQSALRTYISRAKKYVIREISKQYGIDFPYIEYNQGIDKDKTIERMIYQINVFLQKVEDNG